MPARINEILTGEGHYLWIRMVSFAIPHAPFARCAGRRKNGTLYALPKSPGAVKMKHVPSDMIHADAYRILQHPPERVGHLSLGWWLAPTAALGFVVWYWFISTLLAILG